MTFSDLDDVTDLISQKQTLEGKVHKQVIY